MKISCLPVSLFSEIIGGKIPLAEWFEIASRSGLDGADISMNFIQGHCATYLNSLRKIIKSSPLPLVMCTTYPDFTHPDPDQRERELAYVTSDIAVCSELGIPYLRVLAGQKHPDTKIDDGIRYAIDYLRKAAQVADRFGVKLLYEDHAKPGAWDYIDMTFPPELFLRVVDGIWDTSIGINFDTGNIVAFGADPVPIIKKVLPKIETIHVTDMAKYGEFSPVLIGTGVVPLKECFKTLKEGGFDNWLCIEEASNQGIDGVRKATENTRRLWNEA